MLKYGSIQTRYFAKNTTNSITTSMLKHFDEDIIKKLIFSLKIIHVRQDFQNMS